MSVEKEYNAEGHEDWVAEAGSENPLATLSEEKEVAVQLDKVKRLTVEPGLLRLPVKKVSSAKENEKLTIELFHPVVDNPKFHLDKPTFWDKEEEPLPKLMDWYGYKGSNYHQLQTDRLYIRRGEGSGIGTSWESTDWEIVPPPEWSPPKKERLVRFTKEKLRTVKGVPLPELFYFGFTTLAVNIMAWFLSGGDVWMAAQVSILFLIVSVWLYAISAAMRTVMEN